MEPITILPDGSIPEVKMTSQGPGEPFGPGEKIMGYQACGLSGSLFIDAVPRDDSLRAENDRPEEVLTNIAPGDHALFRYISGNTPIHDIRIQASGSGTIEVCLNDRPAGMVRICNGVQTGGRLEAEPGIYELKLVFAEADALEVEWLSFA